MIERLNAALEGRYRIEREIGAGGMATVYVARDERHDRRVAVKVLRAELAALVGAERFLAEIRTTAALQHPHILPLFDSGEADGFLFFVMPYVEGDTLRDRLAREKQLPVDEAVRIAAEVADALDYAHRQGIVHRDVKPANILLHDGRALVADFGIALAVRQAGGDRFTETGLSLGTPHYMSPEQAAGDRSVDARADVYALGCVLYEMLAGQPPHTGPNAQAVLAKVLTAEPQPVSEARRKVPAHVDVAVMKALEKLPADRFASAGEFARALRDPSAAPARPVAPIHAGHEGRAAGGGAASSLPRRVLVASNLVLLLAVLGLGILVLASGRDTEDDVRSPWVTRLLVDIDPSTLRNPPALSANGEIIAWPAEEGVRVQSFDRLESRLIPGTAGARSVGISVDGRELSYIMDRELRTVPVDGGAARTLADRAAPILQTIWSDDDWIYFKQLPDTPDQRSVGPLSGSDVNSAIGMARVHARTGTVEIIEIPDTMPAFVPTALLPDGRHLLLTLEASSTAAESAGDEADLVIGVLDRVTGGLQVLTNGTIPRYEPSTGHLLFKRDETLMAVPMDAERIELTGPEFAVAESIGHFGIARDGTLWYVLGPIGRSVPVLLDRRGRPREILPGVIDQYDYSGAYFSPDGNRLVLTMTANGEDASNLWVYDLPDGPLTRLTFDQGFFPAWTLDGRSILFTRQPSTADSARVLQAGGDGVYRVPADATGPAERVLRADGIGFMQPTPDGGIVFELWNGSDYDIGHASLDGGDSIRMLVSSPANEEDPAISPDGRWLAWESDETGRRHVFVMPFGGPGRGRQVSIASGNNPFWSRSGEELFFYNDEQAVIEALRFRADSTFEVMARETLFSVGQFGGRYPPGPGDSVFLAQQSTGPRFNTQFVLVRNWIHELEARAAAAGR